MGCLHFIHIQNSDKGENNGKTMTKESDSFFRINSDIDLETEAKISDKIDKTLFDDHEENSRLKFLLLGPGESGKTTVVKQMTYLHGSGYPEKTRKKFISEIRENCFDSIIILLKQHERFVERNQASEIIFDSIPSRDAILSYNSIIEDVYLNDENVLITEEIAKYIDILWNDQSIQDVYNMRSKYQLPFAVDYFFPRIEVIGSPDYIPFFEDILRVRIRTTGINFINFDFGTRKCMIADVGGQRSERRKWINFFQDTDAIIFVAAISEYDESLFENNIDSRLKETFSLWEWVINAPQLKEIPIILFLNKTDLFEDKIKRVSLKECHHLFENLQNIPEISNFNSFEEYFNACKKFMLERFQELQKNRQNVYFHFTCATDTKGIDKVMVSVRDAILRLQFEQSGINF